MKTIIYDELRNCFKVPLTRGAYAIIDCEDYKLVSKGRKFKGVYAKKGHWTAAIYANGKLRHIGFYKDELEAARAYNDAAKMYQGEFARLNIV